MLVLRVGRVYDWWICHPDSVGWLRCAARCWYVRYESHRRAAASILLELGAVVEKMQSCRTNPILHLQLFLLHRNRPKTPVACMHDDNARENSRLRPRSAMQPPRGGWGRDLELKQGLG